ncbi:NAD(P)H-dependent oxidoreductase [Streptomyces sp. NBC_00334]|nr:NADPH-dependent FMN reductase [Streptomyces lienomycini]
MPEILVPAFYQWAVSRQLVAEAPVPRRDRRTPPSGLPFASSRSSAAGTATGPATRAHGVDEREVADLAEVNLPFMNEPHHPRLGRRTHQHTRDWSAKVAKADAFVFVVPEYNYGHNAALKNAIDHLRRSPAQVAPATGRGRATAQCRCGSDQPDHRRLGLRQPCGRGCPCRAAG